MIDEVVEDLVRRVVREELSELPACGGCDEVAHADEEPHVLTVPEVAEMLRLSRGSAYNLVREGKLRSVRVGRRLVVPRSAVDELLGYEAREPIRTCRYCGDRATARYVSSDDEETPVVRTELCGAERCHESLLTDLRTVGAVT